MNLSRPSTERCEIHVSLKQDGFTHAQELVILGLMKQTAENAVKAFQLQREGDASLEAPAHGVVSLTQDFLAQALVDKGVPLRLVDRINFEIKTYGSKRPNAIIELALIGSEWRHKEPATSFPSPILINELLMLA